MMLLSFLWGRFIFIINSAEMSMNEIALLFQELLYFFIGWENGDGMIGF